MTKSPPKSSRKYQPSTRQTSPPDLCGTDAVATSPLCIHETRRLSCDHDDAIEAPHRRHRRDHVKLKLIFHAESAPGPTVQNWGFAPAPAWSPSTSSSVVSSSNIQHPS